MPIVSLSCVSKSFTSKTRVLNAIDLTIEEGEMVALIGASGSGKSTLIRLICGLERLDKGGGRIRVLDEVTQEDGRRTKAAMRLRKHVGVIFQQFNLVTRLTLLTNVLAGRLGRVAGWRGLLGVFPREDKIKALKALERVGMVERAHQRASTLSGGQQQRAAIARVLTQEAKLVLADEPIASLDPASAKRVMETLREINRTDGVTVLVSLHQIDHAFEHCDRIIALKDGEIIHCGGVDEMTPADLAQLYGLEEGSFDLKPKRKDTEAAEDSGVGDGLIAHPEAAA